MTSTSNSTLGVALQLFAEPPTGFLDSLSVSAAVVDARNVSTRLIDQNDWPYQADSLNPFAPCGAPAQVGFGILQGYYDQSNYSKAIALILYNVSETFSCTTFAFGVFTYSFQPQSDVVELLNSSGTPLFNESISINGQFGGYWHVGSSASDYEDFPPGAYTVIAADEWGQLAFLHFIVSSPPVQVVSVLGPVPPYNPGGPMISITLKNTASSPITFLNATLEVPTLEPSITYSFDFGINSTHPLLQNQVVNETRTLIGASFDNNASYPLAISGTLSDGTFFNFTERAIISQPGLANSSLTTTSTVTTPTATVSANSTNTFFSTSCSISGVGGFAFRLVSDSTGAPVTAVNMSAVDRLGCNNENQVLYLDSFSSLGDGWLTPVFPSQATVGGSLNITVTFEGRVYNFAGDYPPVGTDCVTLSLPSGNVTSTTVMNGSGSLC